ncbi:MAG: type II toxin-antitoxin system HigB family toxin [Cyanobacteria bacterium P01_A01_bin.40]
MHLITKKTLKVFWQRYPESRKVFWQRYPESRKVLERWSRIIEKNNFDNFAQLRETFPSTDLVGRLTVFNIGGNKYRLIVAIHFNRHKVYVRNVLTHKEYNQGEWKE